MTRRPPIAGAAAAATPAPTRPRDVAGRIAVRLCGLALLLLGACGGGGPQLSAEEDAQRRACRAEARAAPDVRALQRQVNPSAIQVGRDLEREMFLAETRAFRDCMRRAGISDSDGVEPVIPRSFGTRALPTF
jgi:hypothetical protein